MINFLSTENLFTPVKQNIQLKKWKEKYFNAFPMDSPSSGRLKTFCWNIGTFLYEHGLTNYIDTKAHCRHLKNWPVKGICGRCLSVWGPLPS
jgi:hypothetical protein